MELTSKECLELVAVVGASFPPPGDLRTAVAKVAQHGAEISAGPAADYLREVARAMAHGGDERIIVALGKVREVNAWTP